MSREEWAARCPHIQCIAPGSGQHGPCFFFSFKRAPSYSHRKCSASSWNWRSPSSRNPRSESPRNSVRNHPGIAFAFLRIPQKCLGCAAARLDSPKYRQILQGRGEQIFCQVCNVLSAFIVIRKLAAIAVTDAGTTTPSLFLYGLPGMRKPENRARHPEAHL